MDAALAGTRAQLRQDPRVHERSVRLWRALAACRTAGGVAGGRFVVSGVAQPATEYSVVESEPPELMGRNLNSAAHLLSSATAFFFLAFVFAYFYLRSLNNDHLWRPKHVDPSLTLGTLVMALTVASALLVRIRSEEHTS